MINLFIGLMIGIVIGILVANIDRKPKKEINARTVLQPKLEIKSGGVFSGLHFWNRKDK